MPYDFDNARQKYLVDVDVSENTPSGNYTLSLLTYGSRPGEDDTILFEDIINLSVELDESTKATQKLEYLFEKYVELPYLEPQPEKVYPFIVGSPIFIDLGQAISP